MSDLRPFGNRAVSILLRALLAGGVLWLLFTLVDPDDVATSLRQADPAMLALALLFVPVHLLLRVLRWNTLLRSSGVDESLSYTFRVVLAGYAFSAVTPGELGDVFVRMRFHGRASTASVPALVLLDKLLQGVLILLAGIPAVTFVFTRSYYLACGLLLAAIAVLVVLGKRRRSMLQGALATRWARRFRAEKGLDTLLMIPRSAVLRVVSFAAATLVIFATQEYFILNALSTVPYSVAWTGYWSVMSAQMVFPFFLAGLGIREGAHIYFFGLLGIQAAVALSASLILFTVNILLPSLFGVITFLMLSKRTGGQ